MKERDIEKEPYTQNEERVCEYLQKITNGTVGCGDDPIGFLIASHAALVEKLKTLRENDLKRYEQFFEERD